MAAGRPAHPHLTVLAPVRAPISDNPSYITGADGRCLGFGTRLFYVALLPRRTAVDIIRRHHYSGRVVNNSYVHLGVYLGGALVGAMQLGHALNPRRVAHVVRNTRPGQMLELNRMWLDDAAPRNSESRALAMMVRFVRRALPAVRWIQSFADERCRGALGVVYQAANFLYVGSHKTAFYALDGEAYHEMLLTAHGKGGLRGRYLRANLDRAERQVYNQYRYVYFVKPAARRDLVMRPLPYPKPDRAASSECD